MMYDDEATARQAALRYLADKPWVATVDVHGPDDNGKYWLAPTAGARTETALFGPYAGNAEDEVAGA